MILGGRQRSIKDCASGPVKPIAKSKEFESDTESESNTSKR